MTYKKLAEICGVSVSTVSKAMSGSSEISRGTAERIKQTAKELGINPRRYTRSSERKTIAVIVPEIISVHYSKEATYVINAIEEAGETPIVYVCGFDPKRFQKTVASIEENNMDGIISFYSSNNYPFSGPPVVWIGKEKSDIPGDFIHIDEDSGFFLLMEYLHGLGHRRIGYIGEALTFTRLQFFREAAGRLGLTINESDIFTSDKRFEQIGYEAAQYFSKAKSLPTAVIAAYDEIALGAIYAFKQQGIAVPDDISVLGVNDIPSASYSTPALTTLRLFNEEKCKRAVKLLIERIESGNTLPTRCVCIDCQLIIRESVKPVIDKQKP